MEVLEGDENSTSTFPRRWEILLLPSDLALFCFVGVGLLPDAAELRQLNPKRAKQRTAERDSALSHEKISHLKVTQLNTLKKTALFRRAAFYPLSNVIANTGFVSQPGKSKRRF